MGGRPLEHLMRHPQSVVRLVRILSRIALCAVIAVASVTRLSIADTMPGFDYLCLKYYTAAACDQSLVQWLPEIPWPGGEKLAAPTRVDDSIVDPAGTGELRFLQMRGVYGGSFFVREAGGGPPKGHVVYDPEHHIAYYDEGCCSLHEVVIALTGKPPPRKIAMRSLSGLRTTTGIALGDGPSHVQSIYGPAKLRHVTSAGNVPRATLFYGRVITASNHASCKEVTTFLFERERLIGMSFEEAC
jgi:hypothetical protein